MQLKATLFIAFSVLLAASEAGKVPKPPVSNNNRYTPYTQNPKGGASKPSPQCGPWKKHADGLFIWDKDMAKPGCNPYAKDSSKPSGSKENPAAIHYDPNKQPDQIAIIHSIKRLQEPFNLPPLPYDPKVVRDERYALYKLPPRGSDRSPEDQPPASFGHLPGKLYDIKLTEQGTQAGRITQGNVLARKHAKETGSNDAWVQQVIYHVDKPSPVNELPKKDSTTPSTGSTTPQKKTKRDLHTALLIRDLARALVVRELDSISRVQAVHNALVARSPVDIEYLMSGIYVS